MLVADKIKLEVNIQFTWWEIKKCYLLLGVCRSKQLSVGRYLVSWKCWQNTGNGGSVVRNNNAK